MRPGSNVLNPLWHDIVHDSFGRPIPNVNEDIEYLQETQSLPVPAHHTPLWY